MPDYFLYHSYPVLLAAALLAWLILAAVNAGPLSQELRLSRRTGGAALVLLAAAFALRAWVFPARHQVYFDEFLDQDVAANLARDGSFGETLAAGPARPPLLHLPSRPGIYHVMLAAVLKLTGPGEEAAFRLNIWLGALSTPLMLVLCLLLFDDEAAALASAFMVTVLPVHLRFSGTTELTASSGFFLLATLTALALYRRTGERRAYLWLLAGLLCAVNTRFENLLLLPAAALAAAGERRPQPATGTLTATAALALLTLPTIALFLHNRRSGLFGFDDPPADLLANLGRNLRPDIRYIFSQREAGLGLLLAVYAGLWPGPRNRTRAAAALGALAIVYVLSCAVHPSGDFTKGAFERLAVPALLCLIAAAGAGAAALARRLPGPRAALAAMLAAFALLCLPSYGKEPGREEAEYRLVQESAGLLDRGAYVLSYCAPLIRVVARRPVMSLPNAWDADESLLDALDDRGRRPVILFKDLWWYADIPGRAARERFDAVLSRRYRSEPIKQARIAGRVYGFYRLTRKRVAKMPA